MVVVVAWAAIEAGLTIYDAYSFAESLSDPCADAIDVGFGGSGLLIGAFAPGGGYGIGLKALRRPYIRKSTREGAERVARRDPTTGDFLDYNTGERIPDGKYDLGHRYGDEYWRLRDKATREGLSQKEFNDLLNDPDLYRIEHPRSNRSHAFEMPK